MLLFFSSPFLREIDEVCRLDDPKFWLRLACALLPGKNQAAACRGARDGCAAAAATAVGAVTAVSEGYTFGFRGFGRRCNHCRAPCWLQHCNAPQNCFGRVPDSIGHRNIHAPAVAGTRVPAGCLQQGTAAATCGQLPAVYPTHVDRRAALRARGAGRRLLPLHSGHFVEDTNARALCNAPSIHWFVAGGTSNPDGPAQQHSLSGLIMMLDRFRFRVLRPFGTAMVRVLPNAAASQHTVLQEFWPHFEFGGWAVVGRIVWKCLAYVGPGLLLALYE